MCISYTHVCVAGNYCFICFSRSSSIRTEKALHKFGVDDSNARDERTRVPLETLVRGDGRRSFGCDSPLDEGISKTSKGYCMHPF